MNDDVTDRESAVVFEFTTDRTDNPASLGLLIAAEISSASHVINGIVLEKPPSKIECFQIPDAPNKLRVIVQWAIIVD